MNNSTPRRGMKVRTNLRAGPRGCSYCGFTLNTQTIYYDVSIPAAGGVSL